MPLCPDIALDPLGHHAASCRHGGDVVAWHNRLRDIFANFYRWAHLSVQVEVGYGLISTPVLLISWFRDGTGESQQPLTVQLIHP